jgi:hypothetical protein
VDEPGKHEQKGESASADHVAGTKQPQNITDIIKDDYLPQHIFDLDEMGLKFMRVMQDATEPYKEGHNNMQKKAKQLNFTSFFTKTCFHICHARNIIKIVTFSNGNSYRKYNKMQKCIKTLLFHIFMKLRMFWVTHRPSSGA